MKKYTVQELRDLVKEYMKAREWDFVEDIDDFLDWVQKKEAEKQQ